MRTRTVLATAAAVMLSLLVTPATSTAASASPDPHAYGSSAARSEAGAAAQQGAGPRIVRPAAGNEEVPGGWRGPVGVDFTGATAGTYTVRVACDRGYSVQLTHSIPEDGETFSETIPPMPANRACGVEVWSAADEDMFATRRDILTTSARFALEDLTATGAFYPRRRDGFLDELRLDYWLTQPATVVVDVINAEGRTVTTLERRHRYSGGNAWTWDGRTARGGVPRSGRYIARVRATNLDGLVASARVGFFLADAVRVRPGQVDKVRVGMTIKQAMATGQLRRNVRYTVPGVCTRVYPLQARAPHEFHYSVFVQKGRVVEMSASTRPEVALPRGLGERSTAAQVRRAYRGRVSAGELEYGKNALFVRTGRRWIAFGFASYSYDRPLRPRDRLTGVAVSTGQRPAGRAYDGC